MFTSNSNVHDTLKKLYCTLGSVFYNLGCQALSVLIILISCPRVTNQLPNFLPSHDHLVMEFVVISSVGRVLNSALIPTVTARGSGPQQDRSRRSPARWKNHLMAQHAEKITTK